MCSADAENHEELLECQVVSHNYKIHLKQILVDGCSDAGGSELLGEKAVESLSSDDSKSQPAVVPADVQQEMKKNSGTSSSGNT